MGVRGVIEAIAIDKVGDKGSFADNLKQLKLDGLISTHQETVLKAALEVGHAAIHRGYIPTAEQIKMALEVAEHLIHGLYVLPKAAKESIKGIPPKATKLKRPSPDQVN